MYVPVIGGEPSITATQQAAQTGAFGTPSVMLGTPRRGAPNGGYLRGHARSQVALRDE